jgi:hypothetical protein
MIIEDGEPSEFKRSLMTELPDMPKVGDYYWAGASTLQVVSCAADGWMTMKNILHDSNNPRSCGGISTSAYGFYARILKGEMVKLIDIDLSLYDMSRMSLLLFPEEGARKDFKRSVLANVYNKECGLCFSRGVADSEDELVMGCPRCADVSYAIFNSPLE